MRGADTSGDDEFGAMESPDGAWEGQAVSPPVVCALDASLQATQFTQEQRVLMEVELQWRLALIRQKNLEYRDQTSNHALTMELTTLYALDQGPRDLFPQASDDWEDPRRFEGGPAIDRHGPVAGSYTEMSVKRRLYIHVLEDIRVYIEYSLCQLRVDGLDASFETLKNFRFFLRSCSFTT